MNSLASVGTSQNGLLAALALPMVTGNVAPQAPAFMNIISLLLSSPASATPILLDAQKIATTTASPADVADSMIRSMLGNQSSGSTQVAGDLSALGATLPSSLSAPAQQQVVKVSSEQTAARLSSPTSGSTVLSRSSVPPVSLDTRKQLRSVADLPVLTAVVISMPTVAIATSSPQEQFSTGPSVAIKDAQPLLGRSVVPLAKNDIAFTAILTPIKDINTAGDAAEISRPIAASPNANSTSHDVSSEQPSVQSVQLQTSDQGMAEDSSGARPNRDLQQGGDAPSQHQDDAAENPIRSFSTDAKVKPASLKVDDNAIAGVAPERAPFGETSLLALPDQPRNAVAAQSDLPPTAPPTFHSAAEALRTSEPEIPAPQLRAGAAQEISIRLAQPDASTIDLRVVERSGQVHVDVRSSDAAMQTSLRQDLGTLTNSLERAGYHTETFAPASTVSRTSSSQPMGNQDDRQDQSQNRGSTGDFSGGRRQQQPKRPSTWLEEMEDQQ